MVEKKQSASKAPAWLKIIYLSLCQHRLIFKAKGKDIHLPGILSILPGLEGLALYRLKTGGGKIVIEFEDPLSEKQPLFIMFHGNRGHWQDVGGPTSPDDYAYARDYRLGLLRAAVSKGAGVVAVSMRGYGLSEGCPSEKAFLKDIDTVLDFVRDKARVPSRRVIVLGESLGGALAIMAAERMAQRKQPPAIAAAVATFTSMVDRAHDEHPDVPIKWIRRQLRHSFDSIDRLNMLSKRTWLYFAHPAEDEATNKSHSERLSEKARALGFHVTYREFKGAKHVTWPPQTVIEEVMKLYDTQVQEDADRLKAEEE